MKNYKKRNAGFVPRIFTIALVTVLTATTLWAKPKNTVEYTPFKSENPNATVFECELIPEYDESLYLYCSTSTRYYGKVEVSSVALYGWKKKKGGWEKLGEYQPKELEEKKLVYDCDKYTRYAVEFEAPENTMTLLTRKDNYNMHMFLRVSDEYEKMLSEKHAAELAEQERLAAEEEAKKNAKIDAKAKQIAKGYVYHGIDEVERNVKLFSVKALEEGHAYYISNYIAGSNGSTGAAAAASFIGSYPDFILVEYANLEAKAEVVTRTSYRYNSMFRVFDLESVPVVVTVRKGSPIILGVVDMD